MKTQFLRKIQFCNFYNYFDERIQLIKVEIFGIKYIHTNSVYDLIHLIGIPIDKQSFEHVAQNYKRFFDDYNYCKLKFKGCSKNVLHIVLGDKFKEYPSACNLTYEKYYKYVTDTIRDCKEINSKNNYLTSEVLCIGENYTRDKIFSGIYIPDWSLIQFIQFLTNEYHPELEIFRETVY